MKIIVFFIGIVGICQFGQGQDLTTPQKKGDTASYLGSYYYNSIQAANNFCHQSQEQWITLGATALFAGSMFVFDEPIHVTIQKWNTPFATDFGKAGNWIGHPATLISLGAGAALAGKLVQRPKLVNFGLDQLQTQAFTGGITLLVKHLTHRARPNDSDGPFEINGPLKGWQHTSFFSGHSAGSFATATLIFLYSNRNRWVGLAGYSLATGVAISRMQMQKHWASDVVVGALVGTAVARYVYFQQEQRRMHRSKLKKLP